jgi:hypothetical protein
MIAYNNEWLNNLLVQDQADKAINTNCISKEEKEIIAASYPVGFYSPNFFVRIGLFILTWVILIFGMGLISLIVFSSLTNDKAAGGIFIFFGVVIYGGLELMVNNKHYKSGVDDALMWMSAGCVIGGLNTLTNISSEANAILIFMIALFLFLRFTNMLMAGIASLALLAIIFFSVIKFGAVAKAITPFVIMIASAFIYFFTKQFLKDQKWKHYFNGLLMISITALVCFYVAGNYFVVREASIAMFNLDLKPGETIAFGWLFWLFTICIPVLYIIGGIQSKDAILLRVGLLLLTAVVFTVRYYYHILPAEAAMVIGGIIFIVIAYALIKYLHEPKYGFTDKQQDEPFFMDKLNVESLVIAQSFSGSALPATDTGTQFGGGSGGGGGAGGAF